MRSRVTTFEGFLTHYYHYTWKQVSNFEIILTFIIKSKFL